LEIPGIDPVKITMFEKGKIGIDAPDEVKIIREELLEDSTD
jgi:sRNA-binding carbon storage regulator CsrA